MKSDLYNLINTFSNYHVLILGEAMLDSYLEGSSERLCREAPVPVVIINDRLDVPGGAANTAVNVRSLGGKTTFLSVLGKDPEGETIKKVLRDKGVGVEHLLMKSTRTTLAKHRVIAGSQMVVRFDQGSTEAIDRKTEKELISRLNQLFLECDALIISDYGYGIVTPRVIRAVEDLQRKNPRVVVVDSKNLQNFRGIQPTVVKPNFTETLQLLGIDPEQFTKPRPDQMIDYGERILEITGTQIAAVTIDEDGALLFEHDQPPYRTYARPAPHSRSAGAGDTFVAALTLSLIAGAQVPTSAEIASAAASIVVGTDGTSACEADDLKAYFATEEKYVTDAFYLAARIASYHRMGKRIVFTNGCFDILHRGHVSYLNSAKSFGDVLIIGLNSDNSVRRLKGENRPINSVDDRAQILSALSCVDHIIPFDGDTPVDLIRIIKPDIYVKGGDYTKEKLPEAPVVEKLGGKVEILPYLPDRSTTSVIERIRKIYAETH